MLARATSQPQDQLSDAELECLQENYFRASDARKRTPTPSPKTKAVMQSLDAGIQGNLLQPEGQRSIAELARDLLPA